ncbi:MAPEG family protein [Jannaschia seohaensis]|uniref:Putative MAPEG superfamily protein n=1 Tax=Jannaschia seohaensis TaxID=475081 RepID=A0A2Y9B9M4_9RHOB|nr:MAPEG family protein [Jannaschia seohaensis]PWJ12478.1 putative MAPEG superfamily protein [Jannaschia seohaensis]SSA50959.1 Uncharacterized conserved protein, MAPEG superfamily [Jannaschia seohaensis]
MAVPAAAQPAGGASFGAVFEPYSHALVALALWAVLMVGLSMLSVSGAPKAKTESGHPVRDYSDPAYRRHRAFQNAIETSGPFVAALLAAILTGASAFWVNLFASLFLVARIAMVAVHVGTENQPMRSTFWLAGTVCVLAMAALAVIAGVVS